MSLLWGANRPQIDLTQASVERICIIKPSALGDVVQALPLLSAIRQRFPSASVQWVINSELADLLRGHPLLDGTIPFERRGTWRAGLGLLRELRRQDFDLVFDLQGLLRTAAMSWATGAPLRVGLETAREGSRFSANVTIPETGSSRPAYERYWQVAAALGVTGDRPRPIVPITEADRQAAFLWTHDLPRPLVVVHPGAKWVTKQWPADQYAAVAARAAKTWDCGIVVVGSRSEAPLTTLIEARVRAAGGAVRNLAGATSLRQLAAVLQTADLMLSNDSGPMHLAAELGTPVVGLFTCTSPVLSGPPGGGHEFVTTKLPCAAGYHKLCPLAGEAYMACHAEITQSRVWEALSRQMSVRSQRSA